MSPSDEIARVAQARFRARQLRVVWHFLLAALVYPQAEDEANDEQDNADYCDCRSRQPKEEPPPLGRHAVASSVGVRLQVAVVIASLVQQQRGCFMVSHLALVPAHPRQLIRAAGTRFVVEKDSSQSDAASQTQPRKEVRSNRSNSDQARTVVCQTCSGCLPSVSSAVLHLFLVHITILSCLRASLSVVEFGGAFLPLCLSTSS